MSKITRKIEIIPDIEGLTHEESNKKCYATFYGIDRKLYKVANLLVCQLYGLDNLLSLMRLQNDEYTECQRRLNLKSTPDKEKDAIKKRMKEIDTELISMKENIAPKHPQSYAYRAVKSSDFAKDVPSDILDNLKQDVYSHFNSNKKEQIRGERALTTYKQGMPIPFDLDKKHVIVNIEDDYYFSWFEDTRFRLNFGRDRSNNRYIIDNCIKTNKYKLCKSAKIQLKNKKLFILLTIDIPEDKHEIIKGKVLGVDLGLAHPAYVAVNDGPERSLIGDGAAFQNQRDVFRRRFRELQRCQLTQGGHGRKHKTKATENLRGKERNWIQTENHRISREIINLASRWKVETIQMENLKGFGRSDEGEVEKEHKRLLGRWSYFELQKDIEYKASMAGIKVKYVNPAYTSQTCHVCGQRGDRTERDTFVCTNSQCSCFNQPIDADWNAAVNIAKSKNIIKKD